MPRTAIAVTSCRTNSQASLTQTVRAAGLTGTSGLYIPATATPDDRICLYACATVDGATGTFWVKAGTGPNYGQGDLTCYLGYGTPVIVGPLERARFGQADGTINVDNGGMTGIFAAIDV